VVVRQKAKCTLTECRCDSRNGIIAETAAVVNVHKCILYGPLVYTDFTGGDVSDSVIANSKSLGLSFQGKTKLIKVSRNRIQHNQSVGMLACRGAQVIVTDNDFVHNTRTQIEVQGETSVRIMNNRIKNGEVNGILVTAQATQTIIRNNVISGHRNAGVSVLDGSTVRIVGNTIKSCGASGIFFTGKSGGVVLKNDVSDCYIAGLELEGESNPSVQGNTIHDCAIGVQTFPLSANANKHAKPSKNRLNSQKTCSKRQNAIKAKLHSKMIRKDVKSGIVKSVRWSPTTHTSIQKRKLRSSEHQKTMGDNMENAVTFISRCLRSRIIGGRYPRRCRVQRSFYVEL
jgi:parallel beta-helix repeat protein